MKQVWKSRAGLQLAETNDIIPRNGEVRIRVEACGIAEMDLLGRRGPFVPGREVAGVVDAIGQGTTTVTEGDAVLALTNDGGYADLVCVPQQQVFRRLDWMSAADGAALPLDYLSAYLLLMAVGSLRPSSRVLVRAGHSGVGLAALDICRIVGAETIATAPLPLHDALKARGVGALVDDTKENITSAVRTLTNDKGVQIVVDPGGGRGWRPFYALLMPTGRYVHLNTIPVATRSLPLLDSLRRRWEQPRRSLAQQRRDNKAIIGLRSDALTARPELLRRWLAQIIDWYDEALFRPLIAATLPLTAAATAQEQLQARQVLGKFLLDPALSEPTPEGDQ